jgi:hypothetical protein
MLAVALRSIVSLAVALLLLMIVLAAGSGWTGLQPDKTRNIPGRTLQVIIGSGVVRDGGMLITGYEQHGGEYYAVAVWSGALQAQDFRLLVYKVSAQPAVAQLNVNWRRADDPSRVFSMPLNINALGPSAMVLSEHPEWRGNITELGFYVVAERRDQNILIEGLALKSGDAVSHLETLWSSWSGFRGWTQRSINLLRGTANDQALSPVPVAAAWMALASLLLFLFGVVRGRHLSGAFLVVLLVPWISLDLLWQLELDTQLAQTREKFGGKTVHQKHLADDDATIYRYITRLKNEVLPTDPVRLIVAHDSRGHNSNRLKAQYYLLPYNVYNFGTGPPLQGYGKGDYILVLGKPGNPAFDRDSGKLVWRGDMQIEVELLDTEPMGALYRVTRRPLNGRKG